MQITVNFILLFIFLISFILVIFNLPGNWLLVSVTGIYAIFFPFDQGQTSFWWVLTPVILIALLGEAIEFLVSTVGSKSAQVSNGAIVASFIGGIFGAIIGVPIFLIGALFGLLIGVFLGAFLYELLVEKDAGKAYLAACTVLATRIVATGIKASICLALSVYVGFKLF